MSVGYVYIFTNPSMPDWVKIGSTQNIEQRLKDLNKKTAVPLSFVCFASLKCEKYETVEKSIHDLIDTINPELRAIEVVDDKERRREFFQMSASSALSVFKRMCQLLSLPDDALSYGELSDEAVAEMKSVRRKPNTTFEMVGVKPGDTLYFLGKPVFTVTVVDSKNKVQKDSEEPVTISNIAARSLNSQTANGFEWFSLESDGRSLWDIRESLEASVGDN